MGIHPDPKADPDHELKILFLCLRQAILTGGMMFYLSVCSCFRSSIMHVTSEVHDGVGSSSSLTIGPSCSRS